MNKVLLKLKTLVKNPKAVLWEKVANRLASRYDDEAWIRFKYWYWFGRRINLEQPQTFNEKLNWIKLHDRNPRYTLMADKYEVKKIVAELIGDQYVVPCYGVWSRYEDIDFSQLPQQFALKCNHNSGGGILCRDKNKLNHQELSKRFKSWQTSEFYQYSREWPYKNIKRCILAEELLDDHSGRELRDYKFWCFNGEPRVMYITNKARDIYENFYDMEFKPLPINHGFSRTVPEYKKPELFELMKELAAKLSQGIPFVRVDFFDVNGRVYFGEYTFFDWGGFRPFSGDWDLSLGKLIDLGV